MGWMQQSVFAFTYAYVTEIFPIISKCAQDYYLPKNSNPTNNKRH